MIFLISLILGVFLFTVSSFFRLQLFNDFYSYYIGGKLLLHNLPLYGITDEFLMIAQKANLHFLYGTGYSYPPLLAVLMIPLSTLPFTIASILWISLQIFLYVLFVKNIIAAHNLTNNTFYISLLLFFGPALGSIINGQINILILWCLYYYLYSKNDFLRAFSLCFAGWIKVFPFVFLAKDIILKKTKFVFLFILLSIIFLLLQSSPNSGQYIAYYFVKILPQLQTRFDPYITNQSLVGVISRFIGTPFNTVFIMFGESILFLLLMLLTRLKGRTHKEEVELIWLLTILLCAGKNSYWNMTPAFFIYLYFFKITISLDLKSRIMLAISVVLNIIFPYLIMTYMKYPILLSSVSGKLFSSLGFFSLLLLYYPLLKRVRG